MKTNDQVLVSRADLIMLVEFQKTLDSAFAEMGALFCVITEKLDSSSSLHHLAFVGVRHADNWRDYCLDSDGSMARLEAALDAQYMGDSK